MERPASERATVQRRCFLVPRRLAVVDRVLTTALADRPAEALAVLLPMLGCGEEAAAMAFDGLATELADTPVLQAALQAIAAEERIHDLIIQQLEATLPPPVGSKAMLAAARRFHVRLSSGGMALHLARIAALDSAVCSVLSGLLRNGRPLGRDPVTRAALHRIYRDEARHVRVSRNLAMSFGVTRQVMDAAVEARESLANVLALADAAFETLTVDPAVLNRTVRQLPKGLFA